MDRHALAALIASNGQRPDDWKKDQANRSFMEAVAFAQNAPVEGIWKGQRGKGVQPSLIGDGRRAGVADRHRLDAEALACRRDRGGF